MTSPCTRLPVSLWISPKWRYETIAVVLKALDPLRGICENELKPEWFANTQERQTMVDMFEACADHRFWKWVTASRREIWKPAEDDRRRSIVCTCTAHVQARLDGVKHISCYWNGRRLPEAFQYVTDLRDSRLARARNLDPADTEGDHVTFGLIKTQLG